jgi:hypothetical protein
MGPPERPKPQKSDRDRWKLQGLPPGTPVYCYVWVERETFYDSDGLYFSDGIVKQRYSTSLVELLTEACEDHNLRR